MKYLFTLIIMLCPLSSECAEKEILTSDMKMQIHKDFGSKNELKAQQILMNFSDSFEVSYEERPSPRILRCILKLSSGEIKKLEENVTAALGDWRDILYWGEHDTKSDKRIYDCKKPFK